MTEASDYLSEMLTEAQRPGECVPPRQLLDALKSETNALVAMSDPARAEAYFAAFSDEFGYFPMERQDTVPMPPDRRANWIGLFRWLFAELAAWNVTTDPHAQTLGAAFIAAQSIRGGAHIWAALPGASLVHNLPLIKCLAALTKSADVTLGVPGGALDAIWEREALEKFRISDQTRDWAEVGQFMQMVEHAPIGGGIVLTQSIRLLSQVGLDRLVAATDFINNAFTALQIASALPRAGKLSLAAASKSPYVQFACVYAAVSRQSNSQPLSSSEQRDLSATLLKVAGALDQWMGWMKVFGTYPVRYPSLQSALGAALVTAPESALQAYIDVISLHPLQNKVEYGDGRRAVADCLRTFRNASPPERRHLLWRMAYARWSAWDFGKQDGNQHLFAIHWSDLDYAVAGYIAECLDASERMQEDQKIRVELQDLDMRWFASISDLHTAWYRLLSRMQPYAHVAAASPGEDWLCETLTYWPFDRTASAYVTAKFAVSTAGS